MYIYLHTHTHIHTHTYIYIYLSFTKRIERFWSRNVKTFWIVQTYKVLNY